MNQAQALGALRHLLTFAAGWLAARGYLSSNESGEVIAGGIALAGFLWSHYAPEKSNVAVAGGQVAEGVVAAEKVDKAVAAAEPSTGRPLK